MEQIHNTPTWSSLGKIYNSRDEQIRTELTKDEVIRRIEEVYHQKYNPDLSNFDAWDQLLACEAVAEAVPISPNYYEEKKKAEEDENKGVIGIDNGSYKRKANFELADNKLQVINKLKSCYAVTPPLKVAKLLEEFFGNSGTYPGWWLYIAQHYTPKSINSIINQMVKLHTFGSVSLQNPAAYFTKILTKFHPKRKCFRKKEK